MARATPTPTGPPRVLTAFTRDRLVPSPWLVLVCLVLLAPLVATPDLSRGRLSPATPLPLPITLLAVTDTTSTAPATPTPTGLPRVLTASTRGPPRRDLSV